MNEDLLNRLRRAIDSAASSGLEPDEFLRALPDRFVASAAPDELQALFRVAAQKVVAGDPASTFRKQRGTQRFVAAPQDGSRVYEAVRSSLSALESGVGRIRITRMRVSDGKMFLLASVADSLAHGPGGPQSPEWKDLRFLFMDEDGRLSKNLAFTHELRQGRETIFVHTIRCSCLTMLRNTLEILAGWPEFPDLVELTRIPVDADRIKSLHRLELCYPEALPRNHLQSLRGDFERYLQPTIRPMSIFDMLGPAMVGPSSSHTAGANRIGQLARSIALALLDSGQITRVRGIEVVLLGSFAATGVGHRTPEALGSGLCGFREDDAEGLARCGARQLEFDGIDLRGGKVSFSGFRKGSAEEERKYAREGNANMAEIRLDSGTEIWTITGFSIGGGNVEIRYVNERLNVFLDGKRDVSLEELGLSAAAPDSTKVGTIPALDFGAGGGTPGYRPPFDTFEELVEHATESGQSLPDIVFGLEAGLNGRCPEEVLQRTRNAWQVMRHSVETGLEQPRVTASGMVGTDAARLAGSLGGSAAFDNLFGRAVTYATAVSETNARSGTIVACPTAGACGILPGVMTAYTEFLNPDEENLLQALMIAGLTGMVFFDDVTTAGADFGCQAEVGAAAAMTAAAVAHLEHGTADQVVQAFILTIKNCMGLICDPVAGLVEVPCVKRNGMYATMALAGAQMALAGVRSVVSPDEVVLAVREVGQRLHRDYKETAGAGLAQTRDGKTIQRREEERNKQFFGA